MLFKKYPKILYQIGTRKVELCDLLVRVSFLQNYSSEKAFDEYFIQSGESPEDVAYKVYGTEGYSWLILLVNNILDEDQWYSGDEKLNYIIQKNYYGESYYITNLPDLLSGDIMVKVTSSANGEPITIDETKYRVINNFNKNFRNIWGGNGSGTFSASDSVLFARKNNQSGSLDILSFYSSDDPTTTTKVTQIKLIEKRKNSPIYFKTTNNVVVSPYSIYENGILERDTIKSDVVYSNEFDSTTEENFAKTLLHYYMTTGNLAPGIQKFTYENQEINNYKKSEKIKVLKPEYAEKTIDTIKGLLTGNEIGKRIIIGF